MNNNIKETASAGSIGSASIANSFSGARGNNPTNLKDFMEDFFKKTKNTLKYTEVEMIPTKFSKLEESTDTLSGVFSELKNSERKSYDTPSSTYGVEDDNGNIMKITVPSEQGEEFEERLGHELAEMEDFKSTGHSGKDISMAELLYMLKDEFNILDVEFPTIPSDVIYNADDASTDVEENNLNVGNGDDMDADGEMNPDMDGEMNPDGEMSPDIGGDDMNPDMDGGMNPDDMGDDDSVEDFGDETETPSTPESMLASVMDMLKATAEAEKAKADAEAEKARAKQSEFSAASARIEMKKQEDLVRIESEMDEQKNKEKESKKMADIARHNYNKSRSIGESLTFSNSFITMIHEFDEFDNVNSLRRQKVILRQKFASSPDDSPKERRYKQEQLKLATQEIQAKMRRVQSRDKFDKSGNRREQDNEEQNNNTNQTDDGSVI